MLSLIAQIENPSISREFGQGGAASSPNILASLIATLWSIILVLGALAVIVFIASGAMAWITSNGDKAKIEAARERIVAAIIGLAILFSMFALVNYIFPAIGFDILNPSFQSNLDTPSGGGSGGGGTNANGRTTFD